MSIYLGSLGRLVELKCPASQQVQPEDRYSFETTLEGKSKAQVRPIGRRVWSLGTSDAATPEAQGAIMAFANGEWGSGPFVFVSADAPVTNLLTPSAAACLDLPTDENVVLGGPMDLGVAGWSGRSFSQVDVNGPGIFLGDDVVPVLPGQPVTGAAWVRGAGGTVRLFWYNASGAFMSSSVSVPASGTAATRLPVSALPPAGAVGCRLAAVGVTAATRPSVTWTSIPFAWAAGEGCPKAVLHAPSKSLVLASRDPRGGRYANLGFTVTEVG